MLVNYIRVYQQSGAPSNIVGQAQGNSNLTGEGGPGGPGRKNAATSVRVGWLGLGVGLCCLLLDVIFSSIFVVFELGGGVITLLHFEEWD